MKKRRKPTGQSMTEYSIGIGLVAVVSITALTGLGMNINTIFSGMITQAPPSSAPTTNLPASANTAAGVASPAPAWASAALAKVPPAPPGTQPVCFDGICVNLPVVDASNSIFDTTGGNGAEKVHQFANVLTQFAQQLAQDPNSDSTLVSLISGLANSGHAVGDQQEIIKNQCTAESNATVTCRDVFYNHMEATWNSYSNAQYTLNEYLARHPDSLGATSERVIRSNIENIAGVAMAYGSGQVSGSYFTFNPNVNLVHQSANNICDQGGKNCYVPVPSNTVTHAGQSNSGQSQ